MSDEMMRDILDVKQFMKERDRYKAERDDLAKRLKASLAGQLTLAEQRAALIVSEREALACLRLALGCIADELNAAGDDEHPIYTAHEKVLTKGRALLAPHDAKEDTVRGRGRLLDDAKSDTQEPPVGLLAPTPARQHPRRKGIQ